MKSLEKVIGVRVLVQIIVELKKQLREEDIKHGTQPKENKKSLSVMSYK